MLCNLKDVLQYDFVRKPKIIESFRRRFIKFLFFDTDSWVSCKSKLPERSDKLLLIESSIWKKLAPIIVFVQIDPPIELHAH